MKKYQIIYADPPWEMKKIERRVRPNQKGFDYSTMNVEEIATLKVPTNENAFLFLWTTQTYLPRAFEVMKAWGFNYHLTITWDKMNGMTLFGFHRRTEFLLFGYKGQKPKMFQHKNSFPSLVQVSSKKLRHSEKPAIFRSLIEQYCGDLPRLEMFARTATEGWDVWGNEVKNDIELTQPQQ